LGDSSLAKSFGGTLS